MHGSSPTRRWLRVAAEASVLLPVALIAFSCYHTYTWLEKGEHIAKVSWLPSEASDVTFFKSYTYTVYEFSISEQGFLAWARESGWPVQPIEGEVTVPRYYSMTPSPREPTAAASKEAQSQSWRAVEQWLKESVAVVQDGYTATNRQSNVGDRGYIVAYDRKVRRAYYQTNSR